MKLQYRKRVGFVILTILLAIGATSCYYDYGLSTSDYDVIFTNWDKETNFGQYQTFFMPDSIFHLIGDNDEDDISRQYDSMILNSVEKNFEARGYKRITDVDTNDLPDFVVTISVSKSTYTGGGWYYPPYWGPGWDWGWYPGYWPGDGYYYSYSTGTILVDLLDTRDIDLDKPDRYVTPRWTGSLQGLLSSAPSNKQRILSGINQMFNQSPVLVSIGVAQ